MILDIVEELAISDFPITVRINKNTPNRLLTRVAEVMRHGGGIIAVYNESLIIESLVGFGYSESEARKFANDGCWEVQIPGKTHFNYVPFDSLQILLNDTLKLDTDEPANFSSFEKLYSSFSRKSSLCREIYCSKSFRENPIGVSYADWKWPEAMPTSVVSLFEEGCIENARSYFEGGTIYVATAPHIEEYLMLKQLICHPQIGFKEKNSFFQVNTNFER